VNGSERINRSARDRTYRRVSYAQSRTNRSRRESNPHLRFRKPPFYPLNYGNWNQMSEVRDQNVSLAEFKVSTPKFRRPARFGLDGPREAELSNALFSRNFTECRLRLRKKFSSRSGTSCSSTSWLLEVAHQRAERAASDVEGNRARNGAIPPRRRRRQASAFTDWGWWRACFPQ
jgi:hypothetical protein